MLRLADVARRHGPAYLARHRHAMLPSHVRALSAITHCRTAALGGHLGVCVRCDHRHLLYHSCRHRACPRCGHDATERWLAGQRELLLPVSYFHVIFTIPSELRRLVRSHQRVLYGVLFNAAYAALSELCADDRYAGGEIGALAVLHTWTRTLTYHPHVHMLVPGGALAPDGTWRSVHREGKRPFLVPERALAKRFAGKFLAAARKALPGVRIPNITAGTRWIVELRHVVEPRYVLEYLGRYVHRTAIGDGAILHCDDDSVTFRYRDSRTHAAKVMTLSADEFLPRFLQHVLPKGLHRVRSYGLLNPAHRVTLQRLQLLLGTVGPKSPSEPETPTPRLRCPNCKTGTLVLVRRLDAAECVAMRDTLERPFVTARGPPPSIQHGGLSP